MQQILHNSERSGKGGAQLLYKCADDLRQGSEGRVPAAKGSLLKDVEGLANALVLYEELLKLGGLSEELLASAALAILENTDWEARTRFCNDVWAEVHNAMGHQQQLPQRVNKAGGRGQQLQHKAQPADQQQGGLRMERMGMGEESTAAEHADNGTYQPLGVLLSALDCCLRSALVTNYNRGGKSMYIDYASREGYGLQQQGDAAGKWPCWVQRPEVAEKHIRFAVLSSSKQREFRRACLVHFAVLLLNDLLPRGVFLPWQLVLSYERVIPSSGLRGADDAVAAACKLEEQLAQLLAENDLKAWAAYAREQLQLQPTNAIPTAGAQAGAAAAANASPSSFYHGGHSWLADPSALQKVLEAYAVSATAAGGAAGGKGTYCGVVAGGNGAGTATGGFDVQQQEGQGVTVAAAGDATAMEWDHTASGEGRLLRSSSKRASEHDNKNSVEGQGMRKRSSSSSSLQDLPGASSGPAAGVMCATSQDLEMADLSALLGEQPSALLREPLQLEGEQQRQQQQVMQDTTPLAAIAAAGGSSSGNPAVPWEVCINPDLRTKLVSLWPEGIKAAKAIREGLHTRQVGRILDLTKRDQLQQGSIMAVVVRKQGLNKNQAVNIRRSIYPHLAAANAEEDGNEQGQQQGIMKVFYEDYSTWLPLVCAGGAAEGQTVVVDFASKVGKTAQSGELLAAVLVVLHMLWSPRGAEGRTAFAELVAGTVFEELFGTYEPILRLEGEQGSAHVRATSTQDLGHKMRTMAAPGD